MDFGWLWVVPILGVLIVVHELGHFVSAIRLGIAVEEFGIGFPPRAFAIRRNGIDYSLNWLPIGGFVKITGENGDSDDPRSFGDHQARSVRRVADAADVALSGAALHEQRAGGGIPHAHDSIPACRREPLTIGAPRGGAPCAVAGIDGIGGPPARQVEEAQGTVRSGGEGDRLGARRGQDLAGVRVDLGGDVVELDGLAHGCTLRLPDAAVVTARTGTPGERANRPRPGCSTL